MGRKPPDHVLKQLSSMVMEPGFIQFVEEAQKNPDLALNEEGDDRLSDTEWYEISEMRVNNLITAYLEKVKDENA